MAAATVRVEQPVPLFGNAPILAEEAEEPFTAPVLAEEVEEPLKLVVQDEQLPKPPLQLISEQVAAKTPLASKFGGFNIATWHMDGSRALSHKHLDSVFPGMSKLKSFLARHKDDIDDNGLIMDQDSAIQIEGDKDDEELADLSVAMELPQPIVQMLRQMPGDTVAKVLATMAASKDLSDEHEEAHHHKSAQQGGYISQHLPHKKLDASKVAWLHIPKAGTSFANTLASWACTSLEENDAVDSSYSDSSGAYIWGFMEQHREDCAKGFSMCGGHAPIETASGTCNSWKKHAGNFVGMFRQPEQRLISGFHQNCHDVEGNNHSLIEYREMVAGCSVKMLNGKECGANTEVDRGMVETATRRVDEGFAFVGLTDEWALSVCLFHAMFGGDCHAREFKNVRPGVKHADHENYDTSALEGWVDPFDGALYAHTAKIFWANTAKYGVNAHSCAKRICVNAPETFEGMEEEMHSGEQSEAEVEGRSSAKNQHSSDRSMDWLEEQTKVSDWPNHIASALGELPARSIVRVLEAMAKEPTMVDQLASQQSLSTTIHAASVGDLESKHKAKAPVRTHTSTEVLKSDRLAWLHIPRAGTSFANTLVSWSCPRLEDGELVDSSYDDGAGSYTGSFLRMHKSQCDDGFSICSGFEPITSSTCNSWEAHASHFVTMFRQPEQRIISGYYQFVHDATGTDVSMEKYAKFAAGCTVKMINGQQCLADVDVTGDMVSTAMERLDEGFAFVGLTEEWALSVCLFHAMFGGECHHREFLNVRLGANHTDVRYDTSELGGMIDPFDGALYTHATTLFWNNVAKYDVGPETCAQKTCAKAKDAFRFSLLSKQR